MGRGERQEWIRIRQAVFDIGCFTCRLLYIYSENRGSKHEMMNQKMCNIKEDELKSRKEDSGYLIKDLMRIPIPQISSIV